MKKFLTSTAIVLAMGLPATLWAQNADTASTSFLAARSAGQLLATDLIGHEVYARRTPMDMSATGDTSATGTAMTNMTTADLDGMDNVGEINDLVLANDGTVVAVIIGVGGFLGVGERDVAVTMNEVSFAADADRPENMYIMVNTSGDMLKTSPQFDRVGMANTDLAAGGVADREFLMAPAMEREGYNIVKSSDVSIDLLIGKAVYGTDDTNVGTVEDVTMDANGAVQEVIIDFGGFIGMGTSQVALGFDEMTILTNADNTDIRVYVDASKDQIKAMPAYVASN